MAQIIKQSTAIDLRIGPFVDVGDGFTPETGVTIGASDEAEVLKANGAATVAMAGAFGAVTGCDGWYDYTASAGDTDTPGDLTIVMQDDDVYLPVFARFQVVEEDIYEALFASGAAAFDANDRVSVASFAANALTAAAINAAAFTSAKFATDAISATAFAQAAADKVWSSATRTLTAFSTALALNVWHVLESAIVTASTIGIKLKTNVDVVASTRATPAQVNTEVLDVMNVDTLTLPGQAAPPLVPTHRQAIAWLYKLMRNRKTQTATQWSLLADDESTVDAKATVSDDGSTAVKQEIVSGP